MNEEINKIIDRLDGCIGMFNYLITPIILIMILSADSDNLSTFIISKIIVFLIFYINHLILKNYSRLYNLD